MIEEYITIKQATKVKEKGIAIKLLQDNEIVNQATDTPYKVVYAPIYKDNTFKIKDFTMFGGSVGYDCSEFKTLKQALEFYNDILKLSHKKMAKKYPNLWVE